MTFFSLLLIKQACQTTLKVSRLTYLLWKTLNSGGKVCPALPLKLKLAALVYGLFLVLFVEFYGSVVDSVGMTVGLSRQALMRALLDIIILIPLPGNEGH